MNKYIIIGLIILLSVSNVSAGYMDFETLTTAWGTWEVSTYNFYNGAGYYTLPTTHYFINNGCYYAYANAFITAQPGHHHVYNSLEIPNGQFGTVNNVSIWGREIYSTGTYGVDNHYIQFIYRRDTDNNITNGYEICNATYMNKSSWSGSNYDVPATRFETGTDGTSWGVWVLNVTSANSGAIKLTIRVKAYAIAGTSTSHGYFDKITFNEVSTPHPQANSTFYLYDDCGNLLQNPTTTIFRNMTEQIYQGNDNPITINEAGNYNRYDKFSVVIDTHDMAIEKTVYADDEFNIYYLTHPNVDWELQTFVYDNFTSNAIEFAKVSINQTCRIDDYPTYTYGLTNDYGFVTSYQLSNQNFTVECTKTDYKDYYGEFTANFDAWNSTYFIEIYLDNTTSEEGYDGNETLPDTPCSTAWSNNDNLIISEINDTEDARLHYMAGSSTTLLYLERWSESTQLWMLEGSSITLDPYEIGYIQYTPVNWTEDKTTIYRGRLWSLNCYCDDTSTLKVWNSTDGNETIYDNLTVSIRFLSKIGGHYVNPNAPIQIKAYAASNNTSLLTIDLELYNESTKVDNISLTFFDWYVDSQFKVYKWNPNYDYADGFNYTVKMIGFNGALLAIDHVYTNASGDSPYNTNNELTVFVKDNYNQQIPYTTIFIEDWGSIATGTHNYATVTGLSDGDYQYKATKSGYRLYFFWMGYNNTYRT
jgi:hypothetical protein